MGTSIIVKSDNDLALTSVIESWSTLRAMESGSIMIIGNCLVGSSKSNGFVEGAIQLVQGIIRTVRRTIEEKLEISRGRRLVITHQQVDWLGTGALKFGGHKCTHQPNSAANCENSCCSFQDNRDLQPHEVLQKYERDDVFYNLGWSRGSRANLILPRGVSSSIQSSTTLQMATHQVPFHTTKHVA